MQRADFEHVVAAAANVTGEDEFVVIGSQAILGILPAAPPALLGSMEVDLYPRNAPEKADEIDGALGDGSQFHATYGFYAHGVGPETAKAPVGWELRLERVEIPPRIRSSRHPVALCLEIHDLVLSKCAAGRERDWEYAQNALRLDVVDLGVLLARVPEMPIPAGQKSMIAARLTSFEGG